MGEKNKNLQMEQNTNVQTIAASIRLIGSLVLISGIILLAKALLTEISVTAQNLNEETLLRLPKEIADKTNYTILGGFLIVVGIQLCLVNTKLVSEIKEQFSRTL